MRSITLGSFIVANWAQAAAAARAVEAGSFGASKSYERYEANGKLEALYVHHLMNTSRDSLGREVTAGTQAVGTSNAFQRALVRVKASRGKNPAFSTRRR